MCFPVPTIQIIRSILIWAPLNLFILSQVRMFINTGTPGCSLRVSHGLGFFMGYQMTLDT